MAINTETARGQGENKLAKAIREARMDSLRVRTRNLSQLDEVSSVIFVGSSASGKSTIQKAVIDASTQDAHFAGKISVPRRVITRPLRSDDGHEVFHSSSEEFKTLLQDGGLGLYGIKTMEGGRTEPFGLEKPTLGKLPIFFANNVIVKNPASIQPSSVLENALVVGLYTPDKERERRLQRRSPDLFIKSPEEVAFRLSKDERSAIIFPGAHIIVKNFGRYEERVVPDMLLLIKLAMDSWQENSSLFSSERLRNRYLVLRHGESVANEQGVIISSPLNGIEDFGITSKGREQMKQAAKVAKSNGIHIGAIYASPFQRCRESASEFRQEYGYDGSVVPKFELQERDFGQFEGTKKSNYQIVYDADQKDPELARGFHAETTDDVARRISLLIKELEKVHHGETVLLITHADVGEIAQAIFKGVPSGAHRISIPKLLNGELRELSPVS